MKVLVVDDQSVNRIMLRYLLEDGGHTCIEAENGKVAVEAFQLEAPDFVLMDIMMPVMDGYEAAKRIKELSVGQHTPIIFLTARTEQDSLIRCLDHGDDYLNKPINDVLLRAKISAHQRTLELTQQIQAKNEELTRLHDTLQAEHKMGQHVLSHAMSRSWRACPIVRSHVSSMSTFNGDMLLVARNPKGGLYLFLGDMTGHGLSAAIGTVPVSQVFFAMAALGRSVRDMATELNATLKEFLPANMFCAAAILQVNESGDSAQCWLGGLPPVMRVRPGTGLIEEIKGAHLPLGIQSRQQFSNHIQVVELEADDRLLLMSDGVHDIESACGEIYGEERVDALVRLRREDTFQALLDDIERFSEGASQPDDISLVELRGGPLNSVVRQAEVDMRELPWQLDFHFTCDDLRSDQSILEHVMAMLPAEQRFAAVEHNIQTVLIELYSNALEHGLLKLDSDMKTDASGFAKYYQLRDERLTCLERGSITIRLSYLPREMANEVLIEVMDSGQGFDYQQAALMKGANAWGRGLAMVDSLCTSLEFLAGGRHVKATVACM